VPAPEQDELDEAADAMDKLTRESAFLRPWAMHAGLCITASFAFLFVGRIGHFFLGHYSIDSQPHLLPLRLSQFFLDRIEQHFVRSYCLVFGSSSSMGGSSSGGGDSRLSSALGVGSGGAGAHQDIFSDVLHLATRTGVFSALRAVLRGLMSFLASFATLCFDHRYPPGTG
jgi:hypothetical protein